MKSDCHNKEEMSRRRLIGILGAAGAAVLTGCGSSGTSSTSGWSSGSASCVLTPSLTVGPYFVDDKLNRSDLTTNTSDANVLNGTPLSLTLTVEEYSSSGCSALAGAQVDVWHADAAGIYSDESSEGSLGQTYLRGYQVTDSTGGVSFKTIFPGWYAGRTVHIHIMIRTFSSSGAQTFEFTTQLFFDQTLIDAITTTVAPYSSHGVPDTTNANDNIYKSATQLTLATAGSGRGYTAALSIGVQTS